MAKSYMTQLGSALETKYLVASDNIRGGYLIADCLEKTNGKIALKDTSYFTIDGNEGLGIVTEGSLAYVKDENKFYQYNNGNWNIKNFSDVRGTNVYVSNDNLTNKNNTQLSSNFYIWSDSNDDLYVEFNYYTDEISHSNIYIGDSIDSAEPVSDVYIWKNSSNHLFIEY